MREYKIMYNPKRYVYRAIKQSYFTQEAIFGGLWLMYNNAYYGGILLLLIEAVLYNFIPGWYDDLIYRVICIAFAPKILEQSLQMQSFKTVAITEEENKFNAIYSYAKEKSFKC